MSTGSAAVLRLMFSAGQAAESFWVEFFEEVTGRSAAAARTAAEHHGT